MISPTVDVIEVVWCALIIPGFLFSLYNTVDARKDMGLLREANINHIAKTATASFFWNELVRSVKLFLFSMVGIIALFRETPPGGGTRRDWVLIGLLLFAAALLTVNSFITFYARRKVSLQAFQDAGQKRRYDDEQE